MDKNVLNESLDLIIGQCFGKYAKYIIQDRALPDIRDGLKPVQRRILFAMNELGLTYDKPYKKSARTVGEVIGKYHPHGDSSIYEAMVRMSQDWKNNLPLLDMHGNNGSIDGDPAAAMRYTECRLSKVSNLMLERIKSETVEFAFNFDDSEKEPTILPAMIPNLLINGAMGIAAGYATNIPPFNPKEVLNAAISLINDSNLSTEEILKIMPGPDFPTGAIIEGKEGINEFYNTGRGKFFIVSKIDFNYEDKKVNQIIISQIPYDTTKMTIIKELNEILYEEKISGLIEVRDESDKNGVNIVIDVKKDKNLEIIKNYLLKNTHLKINYAVNFVAIVNRKPVLLSIKNALLHYISHALNIQKRTAIFDLNKCEKRYEVVKGLIIAINNIDRVIALIRSSDSKESAKNNLIQEFSFTDNQAEAIVTLRLYRLSKTNVVDLLQEANHLEKLIHDLKALINSEELQKATLKELLLSYISEYQTSRKTIIADVVSNHTFNEIDVIDVQDVCVLLSRDGYLKTVTKKIYESNFYSDLGHNNNELVFFNKIAKTNQFLILVSASGKNLVLPIHKLKLNKWKDIGEHLNTYMNLSANDKIIFADVVDNIIESQQLLLVTKYGIAKKVSLDEAFNSRQIKQSSCLKLKQDDEVIGCSLIQEHTNYFVSLVNDQGLSYAFSSAEIPLLNKQASGVKTMKLKPGQNIIAMVTSRTLTLELAIVLNYDIKVIKMEKLAVLNRCSIGKKIIDFKPNAKFISAIVVNNSSFINLLLANNNLRVIQATKFSNSDLNDSFIVDASYSNSYSYGLIEDVKNAKILPKSKVDDLEVEQITLEGEENV